MNDDNDERLPIVDLPPLTARQQDRLVAALSRLLSKRIRLSLLSASADGGAERHGAKQADLANANRAQEELDG